MPSPPLLAASRLVWILALPVHTPVSSTWLRCRPRHSGASLGAFWGRITSASDARTFSLVFLSAGFGALCSGVSSRFLPLSCTYYRYISGSAL